MRYPTNPASAPARALDRHGAPRSAARRRSGLAAAVLGLALLPLVADGAKICTARWVALSGPVPAFRTPAIDLVAATADDAEAYLRRWASYPFRRRPWHVATAVSGFLVVCTFGYVLLMGRRREC